jgi:hypothetical protein
MSYPKGTMRYLWLKEEIIITEDSAYGRFFAPFDTPKKASRRCFYLPTLTHRNTI